MCLPGIEPHFTSPVKDSNTLVTDLVMLMKDGFAVALPQCATIGDVFASFNNRRLSGLVIEHAKKLSALLGELCTHLQSYKSLYPTIPAVQLSLTCINVHSPALLGVQGSAH